MRILLVEDERHLAEAVGQILKQEHYIIDIVFDGEDGLAYADSNMYDLIILDIMLPKMDGITILKHIRKKKNTTPVLFLTARSEVSDRVTGLNSGADDYLPKPFASEELIARVKALLRRKDQTLFQDLINFGDLTLDNTTLKLIKHDKEVLLTAKEYELFQYLVLRKGVITPKDMILDKLWGYGGEAVDNNVEVYISFLRKKLKFLESGVSIRTTRGIGYSLEM